MGDFDSTYPASKSIKYRKHGASSESHFSMQQFGTEVVNFYPSDLLDNPGISRYTFAQKPNHDSPGGTNQKCPHDRP